MEKKKKINRSRAIYEWFGDGVTWGVRTTRWPVQTSLHALTRAAPGGAIPALRPPLNNHRENYPHSSIRRLNNQKLSRRRRTEYLIEIYEYIRSFIFHLMNKKKMWCVLCRLYVSFSYITRFNNTTSIVYLFFFIFSFE